MTRDELIDALRELAEQTKDDREMMPAAGILYSLCGALAERSELELLRVCADFSRAQVERLRGEPDWGDDILAV